MREQSPPRPRQGAWTAVLFALFCVFPPLLSAGQAEIKDIKFISSDNHTRVVIELTGPVEHSEGRLKNPERFFIDLKGGVLGKALKGLTDIGGAPCPNIAGARGPNIAGARGPNIAGARGPLLRALRAGQFAPDVARVVMEFEPGKVKRVEVSNDTPERLLIDIYGDARFKYRVVIDAGHGGHDPGAVGRRGLKEKDVTLDIALRLKKLLEKDPRYEVVLTRGKDVFIDLGRRAEIANSRKADMFVSIHANANRKRDARGIETYLLNWTDDEEAQRVAARENAITLRKMKEARSELGVILASLELQTKRDESVRLAHFIQGKVVSGVSERWQAVDLGVKQALFYVLVGARMPSVLVEVSFISNPKEEKLLRKTAYRKALAEGIAEGIGEFVTTRPLEKVALSR